MKKNVAALFLGVFLCLPSLIEAQKVFRVGVLVSDDQFLVALEGFKENMRELGYPERTGVEYEVHNAGGDSETLEALAREVVRNRPDVIVTSSTTATVPVAKLTQGTDLPVVFLSAADPLRFAKSYRSSGNNLTGISTATFELTAKRLELLKELAPWAKRVASLNNPNGVNYQRNLISVREAGKRLGLLIMEREASNLGELARITARLTHRMVDAIILPPDVMATRNIELVVRHAIQEKLPVIAATPMSVRRGGLATYGADYRALGRQGAALVDKIFKGARPRDLPIELPSRLIVVINLKTAKAIGLKVPKGVLLRADALVE